MNYTMSVSGILNVTGLPTLTIKACIPEAKSQCKRDLIEFELYYKLEGIVPILFEVWEHLPDTDTPDSDLTDYWAWFAHYPGIDLRSRPPSQQVAGIMIISTNGRFGQIDGGAKLDVNHEELQAALLQLSSSLGF
jgi:hypothetical protein